MDLQKVLILNWRNFANNLTKSFETEKYLNYLNVTIGCRRYLLDEVFSEADKIIFQSLNENKEILKLVEKSDQYDNINTYLNHLKTLEEIKLLVVDISYETEIIEEFKYLKTSKLGVEVMKDESFSDWYTELIVKSELIEYYDISGCYILRPHAYKLWENIQAFFDKEIKKFGVENSSFPVFISKTSLWKEKDHIADFSPEVAWVTKCGSKNLEEPIAIRPTSETAMYPYYAKWIKSYRDLPLKLNQWCNVVRWEFKHPMPFLRSREFLWQEGHTAYANQEDALNEVYEILDIYSSVYKDLLAIPVVKGKKTENEKFAGADFTTTTEIYISGSGRAIQGATSHHLGQNFSKMFEIKFESANGKQEYVFQNSWGLTTRSIGIIVMAHGDNKGLVLPPRVASIQVVIVPCGITGKQNDKENDSLISKCNDFDQRLKSAGIRAYVDSNQHRTSGWKFNNWELKGIPIRMEIGPKEIASGKVVLFYRYNGERQTIDSEELEKIVTYKLDDIHNRMYSTLKAQLDNHRIIAYTMNDLCTGLKNKMLINAPFCGEKTCENKIKIDSAEKSVVEDGTSTMGAKSLCIPFEQPPNLGEKCINTFCMNKPKYFTMFGRSY